MVTSPVVPVVQSRWRIVYVKSNVKKVAIGVYGSETSVSFSLWLSVYKYVLQQIERRVKELWCQMSVREGSQSNILEFFMLVGKLKHLKRTGWVMRNISNCEDVAGHMYRMSIMAFLLDDEAPSNVDRNKCIKMALVHDIAECIVGDLTPFCGISKDEKHRKELEAMGRLCSLAGEKVGKEFLDLYKEYEEQSSPEAKSVKDLDKFDMILQAFEYEKESEFTLSLQDFFNSTEGTFQNPLILKWVQELKLERSKYHQPLLSKPSEPECDQK